MGFVNVSCICSIVQKMFVLAPNITTLRGNERFCVDSMGETNHMRNMVHNAKQCSFTIKTETCNANYILCFIPYGNFITYYTLLYALFHHITMRIYNVNI